MSKKSMNYPLVGLKGTVNVIERKTPKMVRAHVSVSKVRPGSAPPSPNSPVVRAKRPARMAPSQPPPEDAMQKFMLTKTESNNLLNNLKKFYNANKQLLAVSRTAADRVETLQGSSKVEFMSAQLSLAREELSIENNRYTQAVRDAAAKFDHCDTLKVAHLTTEVASYTNLICAGMKSVAMEFKGDDSLFLPVLTSLLTAKDSLISIIETLDTVKQKLDKTIATDLTASLKNLSLLTNALLACRSGKIIPLGRKLELESAARAATCSIVKLVNAFSRPIEQSIVYETKVASCCISQLWATLNELAGSPNMLSLKPVKAAVTKFLSRLKIRFAEFMECTKREVSDPSPNALEVMKESVDPLRQLLCDIVTNINLFAEIDTSKCSSLDDFDLSPTEEHKKRAAVVTEDPEDLVPPPPSMRQSQSIDVPEDAVPDINPIWYEPNNDDGRILYTDAKKIRCATLNKLLIHLTDNLDVTHMKTFITTYRSFTTPEILLQKIIQRYNVPDEFGPKRLLIQLRCSNLLKQWVETSFADFDEHFISELSAFVKEMHKEASLAKFAVAITASITKKQEERQNTKNEIVSLTIEEKIPLSPANLLFVFPEEKIAKQLTLVDFFIYKAIRPAELLNCAWSKAKYRYRAKNVMNLISRSTLLTRWVSSVIVWQDTLKGRIKALTKFISIAQNLRKLNNFNSMMAILAGINTSAVYRLKFTREGLSQKSRSDLQELAELMDASGSYSNYRTVLHDINPPCVPFLGTYLTDITFIEDGNPDFVQGLINYRKRELVYSVIQEIQQYQQKNYSFEFVDGIAHYLTELPNNDEEVLYELSLEREPRKTKDVSELL